MLLVRTLWQRQIEGLLVRTLWQGQIEGLLVRTLWQGQIEGLLVCILWWSMLMCYWAFWSLEEMASQGAAPAREPDQRGQRRS